MIYVFILTGILFTIHIFFLCFKKQTEDELFFLFQEGLTYEVAAEKIKYSEILNKQDFSIINKYLIKILKSALPRHRKDEKVEEAILVGYFNFFKDRWISFKRADVFLNIIFIASMCSGLACFYKLLFAINENTTFLILALSTMILFLIPLIFGLIFIMFFSMIYSFLALFFANKGSIAKASVISEEMIKALKPGGRWTPITLPNSTDMVGGAGGSFA